MFNRPSFWRSRRYRPATRLLCRRAAVAAAACLVAAVALAVVWVWP